MTITFRDKEGRLKVKSKPCNTDDEIKTFKDGITKAGYRIVKIIC